MYLESTMCAYKGLWRGVKYLGYYIDEMQDEIDGMVNHCGMSSIFDDFYKARAKVFKHDVLGEIDNKWPGGRNNYKKGKDSFKQTGRMWNIEDYLPPCFEVVDDGKVSLLDFM